MWVFFPPVWLVGTAAALLNGGHLSLLSSRTWRTNVICVTDREINMCSLEGKPAAGVGTEGCIMGAMLVHDMRLAGGTPSNLAANNYEVDGAVPVQHAFDWIHSYAQTQGGLDNLYILCHGFEAD